MAPGNVTGATATAGLDKVLLTWVLPTDTDLSEVRIYRGTSSGFTPSGNVIGVGGYIGSASRRATSFVDDTGVIGTAYFYKFITLDISGNASAASAATASATPFNITSANVATYVAALAIGNASIAALDAAKITTGFLAAARIQAGTIDATKLSVSQLSAIAADLGTITAGTITSAIIQTATGHTAGRVRLDSVGIYGETSASGSYVNTWWLRNDGSGFIGRTPGGLNAISFGINGTVTINGDTITTGTITGPLFKTTGTWSVEVGAQALALDGDASTTYVLAYRNGSTSKLRLDQLGNMRLGGDLEIDTGGDIRSGKTSYSSSATGYWLGIDSGVPKFHIGTGSTTGGVGGTGTGKYFQWDGTNINLQGKIFSTSGSGRRITINNNDELTYHDTGGVEIASIGLRTGGAYDDTVAKFGSIVSGNEASSKVGLRGLSYNAIGGTFLCELGVGAFCKSTASAGCEALSNASDTTGTIAGVVGIGVSSIGVSGRGKFGGLFVGNDLSTDYPIVLVPRNIGAPDPTSSTTARTGAFVLTDGNNNGNFSLYLQFENDGSGTGNTWTSLN